MCHRKFTDDSYLNLESELEVYFSWVMQNNVINALIQILQ